MSKRGTAYDISYEHTTDLLRKARSGSTQAIRELLTIRSKAGDTANKRLRALESAGMTEGSAHERASAYFKETSSGRSFRTGKSLKKITKDLGKGLKELKRDIEELRGFLGSKLSTPTGVLSSREKRWETFSKKKTVDGRPVIIGATDRQKDAFLRYLGSAQGQKLKRSFKSSDDWVEFLLTMRTAGLTISDIRSEVREILNTPGGIPSDADKLDYIAEKYGKG